MSGQLFLFRWRDALLASEQTSVEKLVGLALSRWMQTDGTSARPGASLLACACSLSERAVDYALSELVLAHWLQIVEKGGGRGRATEYRATIPKGATLSMNDVRRLSRKGAPDSRKGAPDSEKGAPGADQEGLKKVEEETPRARAREDDPFTEEKDQDPDVARLRREGFSEVAINHAQDVAHRQPPRTRNRLGYMRSIAREAQDELDEAEQRRRKSEAIFRAIEACNHCNDTGGIEVETESERTGLTEVGWLECNHQDTIDEQIRAAAIPGVKAREVASDVGQDAGKSGAA